MTVPLSRTPPIVPNTCKLPLKDYKSVPLPCFGHWYGIVLSLKNMHLYQVLVQTCKSFADVNVFCSKLVSDCPGITLICQCMSLFTTTQSFLLLCKLHSFRLENDFEILPVRKSLWIYFRQAFISLWALLCLKNDLRLVHIVVEPTLYDAHPLLSSQFEKFLCVSSSPSVLSVCPALI